MATPLPDLKAVDTTPTEPTVERDPFDLDLLRLDQSFNETVGVRKLLTTVLVKRPNPQDFMRVHPDPRYRGNFPLIDLKDERELFLVTREMAHEFMGECTPFTLFTAVNRQGVLRIWPCRLPGPDGKTNEWHRSALEAADLATKSWLRVRANLDLGAYEMFEAESTITEPDFPDIPFQEILRIAFKDRFVDRVDHPVVKRLRGLT
jgi:hypothetical protein